MILSQQLLFSDDQAITATAISTNVVDLGLPGTPYGAVAPINQDVGKGTAVPILIQVTEPFNNLTSIDVAIEVGATASLGTVLVTETILLADLVAGKQTFTKVLPNGVDQRYLGVRYTVTGTAPTTGKVTP